MATETIEIYAPIAHRLGMGKVRGELEDLAFRHLDPEAWRSSHHESKRHSNEEFLNEIRTTVENELRHEGIPARVEGRLKRAYSIYQKIKRQKIAIEQVYDLMALRIVTDSVKNCYAALGVIHNEWRPIPGRIKDSIAIPRPNLYQSLHASVVGPEGSTSKCRSGPKRCTAWPKRASPRTGSTRGPADPTAGRSADRLAAPAGGMAAGDADPGEFLSTLKVDLYPEEVYAFTPRGKVIVLPREATPIDFAYAIHSDVGQTCVGAKVNGRIVPCGMRCATATLSRS